MKSILLAIQFLTIIPIKVSNINDKKISQSMIYFPLVGLLLGLILTGINNLLYALGLHQFSIDIILVVSLVFLTGGMHLDGLSDTADAILSRKDKEEMLRIMRDSHAGVMGILSTAAAILFKVAFLLSVDSSIKPLALILMCVLSRWSLVLSMFLFPYARQEGKAKLFIQGINLKIFISATAIALVSAIALWRIRGLLLLAIVGASAYLIGRRINKRIGGITGDTLGAVNEIVEIIVLFGVCILERSVLWII